MAKYDYLIHVHRVVHVLPIANTESVNCLKQLSFLRSSFVWTRVNICVRAPVCAKCDAEQTQNMGACVVCYKYLMAKKKVMATYDQSVSYVVGSPARFKRVIFWLVEIDLPH